MIKTHMMTVPLRPPRLDCMTLDTRACLSSPGSTPISLAAIDSDFSELAHTLQPPFVSSGLSSNETFPKCRTAATVEYISKRSVSLNPSRFKACNNPINFPLINNTDVEL